MRLLAMSDVEPTWSEICATTNVEKYKRLSAQLRAQARREKSQRVRIELENLAKCYTVLADRNMRAPLEMPRRSVSA